MAKGITNFGTSVNPSATFVLRADDDLTGIQGIALGFKNGGLGLPTAGSNVAGIALPTNDDDVKEGEDITVQIKDIGKWIAGGAVAVGDELASNAQGLAVKAKSGDFIVGVALTAAAAANTVVTVQITKSGYKA